MTEYTALDEDTGIRLVYTYDSNYGWSFVASGYPDRATMRKACLLAGMYMPEVPEEDRERVEKNNQEMVHFCRSLKTDREG